MSYKSFTTFLTVLFCATFLHATDLQVISATPKGENAPGGRTPITITFNQPVAALGEKSAFSSQDCPIIISPKVEGTCRFVGTQALQFEPAVDWLKATEYTVRLPGNFTSSVNKETLGKDYEWTFATQRPYVEQVLPYNAEQWVSLKPLIYVSVSQPVDLQTVSAALKINYSVLDAVPATKWEQFKSILLRRPIQRAARAVPVPFKVRPLTDKEYKEDYSHRNRQQVFVVELEQDLAPHAKVMINVSSKLHGTEGNLGPEKEFQSVFYTYPKLEIVGGNFEGCLPFDAQLAFSSPVRLGDLVKHITVDPKETFNEVNEAEKEGLGYQNYVSKVNEEFISLPAGSGYFAMPFSFLHVNPEQTITLKIDKELTDIYGQKLGADQYITLRNSGYCPAAVFKGGTGVLESYLPARHPIDVINMPQLDVQAGRFSRADFIPFFEKDDRYCQPKELAQANLQYNGKYTFDITENKTKKTYLDLSKFHPTARESVIYSQVRVPNKYNESGYCWLGATDNITDIGVTFKTSRENILVWATSLQDGAPKANAKVELRDQKNRILWTGITDGQGVAIAPGLSQLKVTPKYRWDRPVVYAFISSENGDAVIASNWNDGIEPWRFNINFAYNSEDNNFLTSIFTDRGIYRPGEKVYVKGLTRQQKNGQWTLPTLKEGTLTVTNSREEEILKKTIPYISNGSFDFSFELPEESVTGSWDIHFAAANDQARSDYSFRVEAVKQADFAVHLHSLKENYVGGEKAEFSGSAEYLFGAPVAEGKAKWTLRMSNAWFRPDGYDEYEFTPYFLQNEQEDSNKILVESSGTLNAQGQIHFETNLPKVTQRQLIYAELGVQAPTGEQLFSRTQIPLNPADFYIGAKMDRWAVEQGEKASANLIALTPEGKPFGPVQIKVEIEKEEYFSVRKMGLAGRLEWVSDRKLKKIDTQKFTIPQQGADFAFVPKEAGMYRVILSAKDKQGREVRSGYTLTAYGQGEAYWRQNDDDILLLKQDKDEYIAGETARIVVQSPYKQATALVTIERNGVLAHWVKQIHSGADYVDIPIKPEYAPNVFVNVTLVSGRSEKPAYDKDGLDLAKPQGKTGYAQLNVSRHEREIKTTVSTSKKQYLPGEEVTLELNTTVQDKPVPADVTVMAVDEGILALTGYKMPNLLNVFYAPFRLSVSTADNHVFLIGQRNFGEKGENRGGGGGLSSLLGGTDLRSHFEFTPYFNAQIKTNSQGQAKVKFTLPDNLTTFRIMAIASTVQEFGGAETSVKVSKPIMILPKLPRFARRGDEFNCGAVVYNYEPTEAHIQVEGQAGGAISLKEQAHQVTVGSGEAVEVNWPCQAVSNGEGKITFAAQSAQAKDGISITLPIKEIEKPQTLALYSETTDEVMQVLQRPDKINEYEKNEVAFSLASTALLNLRGSMLYLLTYPYDCLEQKMSKILPIIEGEELVKAFNLTDAMIDKKTVQTILNKIPSYQSENGGLGYWTDVRPDPYVTAYTLEVGYRAQEKGYKLPSAHIQKAVRWLKDVFGGEQIQAYPYSDAETKTIRAYAVYVLSLYDQQMETQFNTLYSQRNALTITAKSYLLLAAKRLNKSLDIQNALAQEILNHAQYTPETMHFATDDKMQWVHATSVKTTAVALEALLKSDIQFPELYKVVRWLLQQKNANGYWMNTSDNAAVFTALRTYYDRMETETPNFTSKVYVDGTNVFETNFVGHTIDSKEKQIPFADVYAKADRAEVKLTKQGAGRLYYSLSQTYTPQNYTDDINAGIVVSRKITDLSGNPISEFKAGERYKVTLQTNTSSDYRFVALEDYIPAGFEIVNTSLATESQATPDILDNSTWGNFERDEKYDDRIVVFADYLIAGTHTYNYLIQASVVGKFSYPSLWGSLMYDPAVFGRNATSYVTISPQ